MKTFPSRATLFAAVLSLVSAENQPALLTDPPDGSEISTPEAHAAFRPAIIEESTTIRNEIATSPSSASSNRYHADFEAFCGAIDKCLDDLSGPLKGELTSLMTLNFQFFQNHKS